MNETCKNCGRRIAVQIFKGGDWCSELCRKSLEIKNVTVTKHFVWMHGGLTVCRTPGGQDDYFTLEDGPGQICQVCERTLERLFDE